LHASVVVVDDCEVEFVVDRFAVFGVGVAQDLDDALELGHEFLDLVGGETGAVATRPEGDVGVWGSETASCLVRRRSGTR
jgi:hypothetical protein